MRSLMGWIVLGVATLVAGNGNGQGPFDARRNAEQDFRMAEAQAAKEHKYILLDFGANWCAPCVSLDRILAEDQELTRILNANFVLVPVTIGIEHDTPSTAALRRKFPKFGLVPHLLIVGADGRLIQEQKVTPLFDDVSKMTWSRALLYQFLSSWSAAKRSHS